MEVVALASNGYEAINYVRSTQPDVIILDVSMPGIDGIRTAGQLRATHPNLQIIIISMHYNSVLVELARRQGVFKYISKQQIVSDLVPAIRAAARHLAS